MRLLLLLPAILFTACTGFPLGWQEAVRTPPPDAVSGAWVGTWRSETNGHSGSLRAVAVPVPRSAPLPAGQQIWRFHFRASWAKILSAGFTVDAAVQPAPGGTWTFAGSKDLGPAFGGVFHCRGTLRDGVFRASYEAKLDRGIMQMQRPGESAPRPPSAN